MSKEDFYIGYQKDAPASHSKWAKQFLVIALIIVISAASVFVLTQKPFSKGQYEYGDLTELEGILKLEPVPHLRVFNEKDIYGEERYKAVLLTAPFRFGATEILNNIDLPDASLDSVYTKIRGTLIYNDGKALFELTEKEAAVIGYSPITTKLEIDTSLTLDNKNTPWTGINNYKIETTLQGEIIDPKCYFGAMKPGEGKVHKSCAIRCISGGIPPVFKVNNFGNNEYYILYGEDESPVNERILDFVAERVEITGRFENLDDWKILYINPKTSIIKL